MKIVVEKFEKGGAIPPFAGEFEGDLAICLSRLIASTGDKGIIAAAYDAAIDMACQWQAAYDHEPDPEAVRFEIVKGKDVLYYSRSGTIYLIQNGRVSARAWEQGNGPHSVLENTTTSVVEIPDAMTIGDYLVSRTAGKTLGMEL